MVGYVDHWEVIECIGVLETT